MIPGKQSLLKANSQCINPVTIGWLLRSTPAMADHTDLSSVLKAMWNVKGGFGLYWATIRDGKPYNPQSTSRAIHIEVEEDEAPGIINWAEKTYGRASQHMVDYPLGINMMFVRPYNEVQGSAKALVAKLAIYQQTNEKMLTSFSWYGEMALEKSIHKEVFESLRQWLMSITSIQQKKTSNGQMMMDKLFTGIHRSQEAQETKFYFYKVNESEAVNVISALPLILRDELNIDPGCFFHRSDYYALLDGNWNKDTREYINQSMMNQEQYLKDLDECFSVNRSFFPDMVVIDNAISKELQEKTMAMAQGDDDISILSNLTDKTLKAATSVTGEEGSVQSGNTSRSKTQLAVKEALKEVSLEHNKAMEEQQKRFQEEIATLRKALEQGPNHDTHIIESAASIGDQDESMDVDEEDQAPLPQPHILQDSPKHKRPKRSKSRPHKGKGGPASANTDLNV